MAFMDDLNKKMTNAGKKTQFNAVIAEEEKRANILYCQLGKLYASLHRTDYENELSNIMLQISEVEARISNYRQQLLQIKGVVLCNKCGAEIDCNSVFCPACGNEVPKTENNVELVKCVYCNNSVAKGQRFCTYCGKPMATQEVAPQQEAEATSYCHKCGSKLLADGEFCTECGARVAEKAPVT